MPQNCAVCCSAENNCDDSETFCRQRTLWLMSGSSTDCVSLLQDDYLNFHNIHPRCKIVPKLRAHLIRH